MGLNKPITGGSGLTTAEVRTTVQSIIDAQTATIAGKVDAQTNTLKADLPNSINGGASISDINAVLDEKLPQYAGGSIIKSNSYGRIKIPNNNNDCENVTVTLPYTINPANTIVIISQRAAYNSGSYYACNLTNITENGFTLYGGKSETYGYQVVEFK